MLLINGKVLNAENYPEHHKDYLEKVEELKTIYRKRPLVFKKRYKIELNPHQGLKEKVPGMFIPFRCVLDGKTGAEEWVYSRVMPKVKDGVVQSMGDEGRYHFQKESWIIDPNKTPDLAYFMVYKSDMVRKGKIILYDPTALAKLEASKRQLEAEVNRLIFHDTSEIHRTYTGDEFKMRQLAASWGVPKALEDDELDYSEVQLKLYDRVLAGESEPDGPTKRGIKAFMNEAQSPHITHARAIIRRSIDRDVISYDPARNAMLLEDGKTEFLPIPASESSRYFEYLCKVLPTMPDKLQSLEMSVNDIPSLQPKEVDKMNMSELRELATKMGLKLNTFGMKKPDLAQAIKEKLG